MLARLQSGRRVQSMVGTRDFSFFHIIKTGCGTHPAISTLDVEASSPRVKLQEHEAGCLPPCNAKVKNDGAIPPLPHMPSWRNV
jgi:hypothetical protein